MLSRAGLRAYNSIGSSPRLFELSQKFAGIAARIISPFSAWMWLPSWTGWGYSKDLPRPALKPFRARFRRKVAPTDMGWPGAPASLTRSPSALEQANHRWSSRIPGAELDATSPESPPLDLVHRFMQELEALGARAYRTRESGLPALMLGILRERSIDSVLAWDAIEPVDLARLREAGIGLVRSVDPTIRAGITGALFGIAQTGTLVLTSGAGQPLTASLTPEIHIAVIRSTQILWSLEEALQAPSIPQASAAVLITGPSRTADIEMTLTIGVHGPGELHVFIVDDRA
jgi:L-lactate dehydrogenase complex protein LldG